MDIFKYVVAWMNYFFILFNHNHANPTDNGSKPNIIVIVADDMGWDDVSYHGSNEIPTPNVDALAYNGVILNRHYAAPTCTPSRTSFFTGRNAIRTGLQGLPINAAEPRGLPLREKILPQYLKELGYVTRLVGKWHLGCYTDKHVPTSRGFDSFAGYYNGYIRYFDHVITKSKHPGIDMHMDTPEKLQPFNNHEYMTDFISDQAEDIIKNHDKNKPLYLHLSHLAGHASENVEPLEVRNMTEVNNTLGYIPDLNRRKYAGIITAMDESVGRVVKALGDANILNNSIIIFMSDNGAAPAVENWPNYGSNYPLRGMKTSVFEGAVRVPSCVFSPLIKNRSRVSDEYIHVTDWLPTIYQLAGGNASAIEDLDGIDQWSTISEAAKTRRDSFLVNMDEVMGPMAAVVGKYKLVRGIFKYGGYYSESGAEYSPKSYNVTSVASSSAARAIEKSLNYTFPKENKINELRKKSTLTCQRKSDYPKCFDDCLFDIIEDPCESTDLSLKRPEMVRILNAFIESFEAVLEPQTNDLSDPAGLPKKPTDYWVPWLDAEYTPAKDRNKSAIWSPENYCEGYSINDPRNCL